MSGGLFWTFFPPPDILITINKWGRVEGGSEKQKKLHEVRAAK